DDFVEAGRAPYFLVIVEDDNTGRTDPRIELPKEFPRESFEIGKVFRCKQWHRRSLVPTLRGSSKSEVIEEACQIRVVTVDLVPNAGNLVCREIARNQSGFAR